MYSTAVGKVLLSDMDQNHFEEIISNIDFTPKTPTTITSKEKFLEEIEMVKAFCKKHDTEAIVCTGFTEGGKGMTALAHAVTALVENNGSHFKPLYEREMSIEEKIHTIATKIYGADAVEYSVKAKTQLKHLKELGFEQLPVCMAKTPKSLSDDERKRGRPENFIVTVREFEFAAGAGFVIPIVGEMMRMPGLRAIPAAEGIDIDEAGVITGLS